jgi:hypothetical protein
VGQLTVREYDALERAIVDASRVAIHRRGSEFLVIPTELMIKDGRESIIARHPTTGSRMVIFLDEVDRLEVLAAVRPGGGSDHPGGRTKGRA